MPAEVAEIDESLHSAPKNPKNLQFWLVFLATSLSLFLTAIEFTSLGTALPTIVRDLPGDNFIWIGNAYTIASASVIPVAGGLSSMFGRQPIMLLSIALFALGSALAGAAQSMNWLIAARTVQGVGGGGIISITEIVAGDIVPLHERGKYLGILALVTVLASIIGPPLGGGLASAGAWRWLFYLNLPLAGISGAMVLLFLKLPKPPGHWWDKLRHVDWIGNIIIVGSTTSISLALVWGGVTYPWVSAQVLTPLIVGAVGLAAFILYETFVPAEPIVPLRLFTNRTSAAGYAATFFHGVNGTIILYYIPIFLQGAKGVSAIQSSVLTLAGALTLSPAGIITGLTVERYRVYLPQSYLGFALTMIGVGVFSTLREDASIAVIEILQIIGAVGLGILYTSLNFPILAPLETRDSAAALALQAYVRISGQTYGLTIGITILQNTLKTRLPAEILAQFPNTSDITYAIIPVIPTLSEPLRTQVEAAFAKSCSYIWYAVVGISGLGLLSILPAKALPLDHMMEMMDMVDIMWGLMPGVPPSMRQLTDSMTSGTQPETASVARTDHHDLEPYMPGGPGAHVTEPSEPVFSLSSMPRSDEMEMRSHV